MARGAKFPPCTNSFSASPLVDCGGSCRIGHRGGMIDEVNNRGRVAIGTVPHAVPAAGGLYRVNLATRPDLSVVTRSASSDSLDKRKLQ